MSQNVAGTNEGRGGGALNDGGELIVNGGEISDNVADRDGGGIASLAGITDLDSVDVIDNTAGMNGGGVYAFGGAAVTTITGGTIQSNIADEEGGGVWNGFGQTTVDSVTISANEALAMANGSGNQGGGGVFNNMGTLDIDNATVSMNLANTNDGSGGGVFNVNGTVTISGTDVLENMAAAFGGGIAAQGGSSVTDVMGGRVELNRAGTSGGGLSNNGGTLNVSTTQILDNAAEGTATQDGGGGVFNAAGIAVLDGVTVNDNNGTLGGGALNDQGDLTILNSAFERNDLCAIAFIRPQGTLLNNTFADNVGGDLCPLIGTDGDDLIAVESTQIRINTDELNYDGTIGPIQIEAGAGEDRFSIISTAATNPIFARGQTGDDTFVLTSIETFGELPAGVGEVDLIQGVVTVDGGSSSATPNDRLLNAKDTVTGDAINIGDRVVYSDAGNSVDHDYELTATQLARTSVPATGVITLLGVESLDLRSGSGDDDWSIVDTPANARTELTTAAGNDTLTISSTGASSVLFAELGSGNDALTLSGGGANSGIQVDGQAGDDTFEVISSGQAAALNLAGGGGDDQFAVVSILAAAATELFGDDRPGESTGAAGQDTFDLGNTLANLGNPNTGLLDVQGDICIFGGEGPTSPLPVSGGSRHAPGNESLFADTVDASDTLFISDAMNPDNRAFELDAATLASAPMTLDYEQLESLYLRTGSGSNSVTISDTSANSFLGVQTNAGMDSITMTGRGTGSATQIETGSDEDSILLAAGVPTDTSENRSLLTIDSGSEDDTFEITEVFAETVVDLRGDDGNDTFTIESNARSAEGSLVGINDDPGMAGSRDDAASRELLIDGGGNSADPRAVREQINVDGDNLVQDNTANVFAGDQVILSANVGGDALDLRYVHTGDGGGVLGTAPPAADPDARDTLVDEIVDIIGTEDVSIRAADGEDVLTISSEVPFGVADTQQLVQFDGGGANNRLEVLGGDLSDRISIGPIGTTDPQFPIEIENVAFVRADGLDGDDQIAIDTPTINVVDGGAGDDRLLGGDGPDLLTSGLGGDHLAGRGGDDVLLSDQDFGSDVQTNNPGDVLNGGDEVGDPGDICVQLGDDRIVRCEVLGDGGGQKDVFTFLQAILIPLDELSFDPLSEQLEVFLPAFADPSLSLATVEPSGITPGAPLPEFTGTIPAATTSRSAGAGITSSVTGDNRDVNRDGKVTPLDALVVLNRLRRGEALGESASLAVDSPWDTDVNNDGQTSPLDALHVLNFLRRQGRGEGESSETTDALLDRSATSTELPQAADPHAARNKAGWSQAIDEVFSQDESERRRRGLL
ncbi:MAG: hypothetical protein AAF958_15670 [Planctomycetota bacterium]